MRFAALMQSVPYCGSAPTPAEILTRFNLDPILIAALAALLLFHARSLRHAGMGPRVLAVAGWLVAAAALISPLCALSVALFSARVGQHMVLVLIAAPLIAAAMPKLAIPGVRAMSPQASRAASAVGGEGPRPGTPGLWTWTALFFGALWFWHMPVPYDATFRSDLVYWSMHLTLFGSALFLWRELIHHPREHTAQALAAGALTFVHMGLLGAIIALGDRPLYAWHSLTTQIWGLTPLEDQELGGTLMWVPGIALFLWSAVRSLNRLWSSIEGAKTA
jgi:putative membrane protein